MTTPEPVGPFQKLLPGVYIDANNTGVINAAEVLMEVGMEDTPQNRRLVLWMLQELVEQKMPGALLSYRLPGDPHWKSDKI